MSKSKYVVLGAAIALWVTLFILVETILGGLLGLEARSVEFWPALMGPSLITLLGNDKKAEKNFYVTASLGVLAALAFVGLEHAMVPVLGTDLGVLLPLFLCVFAVVASGFFWPSISGPVSFVYFNAATVLTHDIVTLTIVRLVVLLAGTFIFLHVEHAIVHAFSGKKKPAEKVG